MNRRALISVLGGAAASSVFWPQAAHAQQPVPVVGYLGIETAELFASRLRAFRQGLREAGFVEGQNVAIEFRWAAGQQEQLPALVAELIADRVSVIAAPGSILSARAAKAGTTTIPIVFETGADPVAMGLVESLSRPGGNLTGVSSLNLEVGPKRLELLHELVPGAATMGVLVNPANPNTPNISQELQQTAAKLGVNLHIFEADAAQHFDAAFAEMRRLGVGALVIAADPLFASRTELLAQLTLRDRMPAIHQSPEFARAGGLASYGGNVMESHRQAGIYVGRILKGAKPADLPVQQVTTLLMALNLKTAKAFGLAVPLPLLALADEVIE